MEMWERFRHVCPSKVSMMKSYGSFDWNCDLKAEMKLNKIMCFGKGGRMNSPGKVLYYEWPGRAAGVRVCLFSSFAGPVGAWLTKKFLPSRKRKKNTNISTTVSTTLDDDFGHHICKNFSLFSSTRSNRSFIMRVLHLDWCDSAAQPLRLVNESSAAHQWCSQVFT